jgi:hypothetical protein
MSDDFRSNISFRKDKISEGLKLGKNRFGHTVTNVNDEPSMDNVDLEIGGTGVVAHVDIFESPHMKKFMNDANLSISDNCEIEQPVTEGLNHSVASFNENDTHIDLSDELTLKRPDTLEEFDFIAEKIIGESKFKKTAQAQPIKQNRNNSEQKTSKLCHACSCQIKFDAKFCSNCGTPQKMSNFCNNCGNKYDSAEKFCSECGTKRQ